ncbi:hypothetical protein EVAR_93497_1 [Eumeta japonica]|uniref:Uncharacterized protein n=1 Tax=Eumeta variegata TaxID=151549 RepID=A0A4C1TMF8_EUMVA|nr:hypothetical protein EVAR_93497_1 [Eumeta japonica]
MFNDNYNNGTAVHRRRVTQSWCGTFLVQNYLPSGRHKCDADRVHLNINRSSSAVALPIVVRMPPHHSLIYPRRGSDRIDDRLLCSDAFIIGCERQRRPRGGALPSKPGQRKSEVSTNAPLTQFTRAEPKPAVALHRAGALPAAVR